MPYEVAATAWTQLMGCKRYEGAKTLDAIRNFRDAYRSRARGQCRSLRSRRGRAHLPRRSPSLFDRRSRRVVAITDQSTISTGNP